MIDETSKVLEILNHLKEFSNREEIYLFSEVPSEKPLLEVDATNSMNVAEFLTFAKSLDCKILYYHQRYFLMDDVWEKYFDSINEEKNGEWEKRIKEPLSLKIVFYYNGVGHSFEVKENWLKDYERWVEEFRKINLESNENYFDKEKKMFEQNKQRWCTVLAQDSKFIHAKSFTLRAKIALTLLPKLKEYGPTQTLRVRGCSSEFTELIEDSVKIAAKMRDQGYVYDWSREGKAKYFIFVILDILENMKNRLRKIQRRFSHE